MLFPQLLPGLLLLLAPLAAAGPITGALNASSPDALVPSWHGLPIVNPNARGIIPGSYIVVYKDSYDDDAIAAKQAVFAATIARRNLDRRDATGTVLSTAVNSFRLGGMRAMAVQADDATIMDIDAADEVDFVEADTAVSHMAVFAQTNAPQGLVRLSNRDPGQGNYVFDESAGEGVTAYVIDTGIRLSHSEFQGRATFGANFINTNDTDENGHGSHVAGIIGGATFGVAKKINLVSVKVLDADGAGSNSGVLKGMQFVVNDAQAKKIIGRAVMNMSLGGSHSAAVNKAIQSMHSAGIPAIVAAGNEDQDTADSSPGSAPEALTVAAIDAATDQRAYFSNFGAPVDVYAPGVSILSVGFTSDTATKVLSGTSMACPHITGLAAYLMTYRGVTDPDQLRTLIKNLAIKAGATVQNNKANTTSLIANNGHL
ncbi:Subtilisin-like protease 6 [Escovopsis weberi]|uniref:Subtilisin-like protease 6 n=1 Tax=Escovopsis weberi TaxID=150374 RepID=A0A0M8N278_ESCWE|nr:Subtilisin-like protease 6 [Escovopsis weberi]